VQVWVESSSNISPFVSEKASGTKAGVQLAFQSINTESAYIKTWPALQIITVHKN